VSSGCILLVAVRTLSLSPTPPALYHPPAHRVVVSSIIYSSSHCCQEVAPAQRSWRVVRVFVSSTFADMHNEREVLIKEVFPELMMWAKALKLTIIPCDLRWGVPKDSTSKEILHACFSEIDRCKEVHDALFINMLSERYGWVCSPQEVPEEMKMRYQWTSGFSVTAMEVMHGAWRDHNANAIFLMRHPHFLAHIPSEYLSNFVDPAKGQESLRHLKKQIRSHFPPSQVVQYSCEVDTVDRMGKVRLKNLHNFSQPILEHLKKKLAVMYPPPLQLSPQQIEECAHMDFLASKGDFVIGREEEILQVYSVYFSTSTPSELTDSLQSEVDLAFARIDADCGGTLSIRELVNYFRTLVTNAPENDVQELILNSCPDIQRTSSELDKSGFLAFYLQFVVAWSHPYVIVGEAGSGKSSFMCKLVRDLHRSVGDDWCVLSHFVGSTPGSTFIERLLIRLGRFLEGDEWTPPSDEAELLKILNNVLLRASLRGKKVAIFIDAVNQLDEANHAHDLTWLPHWLPPNIKIVVSVLSSTCLDNLQQRTPPSYFQTLKPLDDGISGKIVQHALGRYNKALDQSQMALLLEKEGKSNPQFLMIACGELRVFGIFELVTKQIIALPGTLQSLYQHVFRRLIEDYGELILLVLCLLETSRHGLLETELLELLGDHSLRKQFTHALSTRTGNKLAPAEGEQRAEEVEMVLATAAADLHAFKLEGEGGGRGEGSTASEGARKQQSPNAETANDKLVKPRLPASEWAVVLMGLNDFLGVVSSDGRIDFYHRSQSKAVQNYCFEHEDTENDQESTPSNYFLYKDRKLLLRSKQYFHGILANYFESSQDHVRRSQELPFQLLFLLDNNRLLQALLDWNIFLNLYNSVSKAQLFTYWREVGGYELASNLYGQEVAIWIANPDISADELCNRRELLGCFFCEVGLWQVSEQYFLEAIQYLERQTLDVLGTIRLSNIMLQLLVMLNFRRNVDPNQSTAPRVIQYASDCGALLTSLLDLGTLSVSELQQVETLYGNILQISVMNEAANIFNMDPFRAEADLVQVEEKSRYSRQLLSKWNSPLVAQVDHSDSYLFLAKAYFRRAFGDSIGFDQFMTQCIDSSKRAYFGYRSWLGEFNPKTAECCMSIAIYCEWMGDTDDSFMWSKKSSELFHGCVGLSHPLAIRNEDDLQRKLAAR
jgi:hypothetical protein